MRLGALLGVVVLVLLPGVTPPAIAEDEPGFVGVLLGHVLDARGAPAQGVVVEVLDLPPHRFSYLPRREPAVPIERAFTAPSPATLRTTVTTGRDGGWRVDGLDPSVQFLVRARRGAEAASDPRLRRPGDPWSPLTLRLRADLRATLRVVDHAGKPVGDATVTVHASTGRHWPSQWFPLAQAKSDGEGRVVLSGLSAGRLPVDVDVPGVGVVVHRSLDVPSALEPVVRVGDAAGATLSGNVVDLEGEPIGGVRVAVTSTWAHVGEEHRTQVLVGATDGAGTWRIDHVPPGAIAGVAFAADGHAGLDEVEARRPISAGDEVRVDVVLAATGNVEGRVVGPEGRPHAGARVVVGPSRTETDALGAFRLRNVPRGAWRVHAETRTLVLPGVPSRWPRWEGPWTEVSPGTTVRLPDVQLVEGVRVRGVVVDPAGRPVRGAWVRLSDGRSPWWSHVVASLSRADGTFSLPPVPPGEGWKLSARTSTHGSNPHRDVTLHDGVRGVETRVVVHPLGRIAGVAQDEEGRPAPDVEVALGGPVGRRTTTDDAGRFAFERLPAGTYTLGPAYWPLRDREGRTVERGLTAGEDVRDVVVRFAPPRTIRGTVVDQDGAPAKGVLVELRGKFYFHDRWQTEESRWGWGAVTDDRGRFVVESVGPGGYWVRPAPADGESHVRPGDEGLRLVWYRDRLAVADGPEVDRLNVSSFGGGRLPLEGRVTDTHGRPVPSGAVRVAIRAGNSTSFHGAAITCGSYRTSVPANAKTIDVEVREANDAAGNRLALAAEPHVGLDPSVGRVDFRMAKATWSFAPLAGRLVDSDGAPVVGVLVRAVAAARSKDPWSPYEGTVTQSDGAFRFARLLEGTYVLRADPGGDATGAETRAATGTLDVELRLGRAAWVHGRVVDEEGRPLWGVEVRTEGPRTRTSFDGSFRVGPVSEAATVEVRRTTVMERRDPAYPEYGETSLPDVSPGTTDLVVRLERIARITGRVVDAKGRTARDAKIRLEPVPADDGREPRQTEQDVFDEAFEFDDLPLGRWRVTATDEHGGRASSPQVVQVPALDVYLTLAKGPSIRGRLVGDDPGDFRVVLLCGLPEEREQVVVHSAPDGTFHGKDVGPGPFLVFAQRRGDERFALAKSVERSLAVRDVPLRPGARIEGVLRGVEGPFDANTTAVWACSPRGLLVYADVDAEGRFVFRGLPPEGRWTLEARVASEAALYRGSADDVPPDSRDVVVVLHTLDR